MATSEYRWSESRRPTSSFRTGSREEHLGVWIGAALVASVVLHAGLWMVFGDIKLDSKTRERGPSPEQQLKFKIDRQATVKDQRQIEVVATPAPREKPLVEEVPDVTQFKLDVKDEIQLSSSVSVPTNITLSKPMGDAGDLGALGALADVPSAVSTTLTDQLGSITAKATPDTRISAMQAQIDLNDLGGKMDDSLLKDEVARTLRKGNGGGGADGFTSLDDLLNYQGPVTESKKAMMPTDLVFEYGSSELKDSARLSLMMLGFIIQKNKDADISLEGHTDTFGGDEYNQRLSEARATAVKSWLVESLRLDGGNIITRGLGKQKPLTGGATPESQARNRRVEIVIKPKKG
jgi:OmpA-OmpF porin, OOP family